MKLLLKDLRKVESKEDLERAQLRLENHFLQIAKLLVELQKFEESGEEKKLPSDLEEELFTHLARFYELPETREILEESQRKACFALKKSLASSQERFSKTE